MSKRRVLVTGGAGFIGTNLIKQLLRRGDTVVSIDNYYTGRLENHQEGCVYIDSNVIDLESALEKCSVLDPNWKPDIVYHLAAMARIQPSFEKPEECFEFNATATLKVAKYCSTNSIPLVYAGTSSHHSGKFKNPYTFSKDIGEDLIKLFQTHYGLQASITRFYNVYGPHHLRQGNYCTLIGIWESCYEEGRPFTIYGDGTKRRDFTHVNDIVSALILINDNQAWGYTFELGRGKNHSIKDIADMFECSDIQYEPNKPGEALETLCEDTLAKEVLGWNPEEEIETYIKEYTHTNKKK